MQLNIHIQVQNDMRMTSLVVLISWPLATYLKNKLILNGITYQVVRL